ncbi:MAG: NAD(P)-dependent oxidoreductase [Candidatus Izemoplasmatales bacterium]|jgi:nucleoside-diphosphate-sugar epimerase|nr:NAD(P)-dependent oxidoreductase [Candidatus Izemoplasmatales bacterium]MDD3865758.1 NAD(P)-dependent oxidoreductase [Candidatus Izemoplasmatales bacterium]
MRHQVKKVFIAGGTGFIGYHTAIKFLSMGINVDTIALPNEIDLKGWYPSNINLVYGNLFEMSESELKDLFSKDNYDTFLYALGPDDRYNPAPPAYTFFYDKLVTSCLRIVAAAKACGIRRCIVLNSYFCTFDRMLNNRLSRFHPYIHARREQEIALLSLGENDSFEIMMMELPYIFGTMPNRKPLWKDFFLSHFDSGTHIYFPRGGGTAIIDVSGVAEAIVAAAFNGENGRCYPVGNQNITFAELINTMMKAKGDKRRFFGIPGFICFFGGVAIDLKLRKQGKDSGLNNAKLMTQILNRCFYLDPNSISQELSYSEFGFLGGLDPMDSIVTTIKACYPNET